MNELNRHFEEKKKCQFDFDSATELQVLERLHSKKIFQYEITKTEIDHMRGTKTIHFQDYIPFQKVKMKDIWGYRRMMPLETYAYDKQKS